VHSWRSSAISGMSTLYSSANNPTSTLNNQYSAYSNGTGNGHGNNNNRHSHGYSVTQRPSSLYSTFSNASTDASSFLPLPNSPLPVFAPRQSFHPPAAPGTRDHHRRSYSGRLSPMFGRHGAAAGNAGAGASPGAATGRQSRSASLSTGGREQLRGLQREDLQQYRNSDVSTIMREEFWQAQAGSARASASGSAGSA
jgi:hypothetical protein